MRGRLRASRALAALKLREIRFLSSSVMEEFSSSNIDSAETEVKTKTYELDNRRVENCEFPPKTKKKVQNNEGK